MVQTLGESQEMFRKDSKSHLLTWVTMLVQVSGSEDERDKNWTGGHPTCVPLSTEEHLLPIVIDVHPSAALLPRATVSACVGGGLPSLQPTPHILSRSLQLQSQL